MGLSSNTEEQLAGEITSIISGVMASIQVANAVTVQSNSTIVQINSGTNSCNNSVTSTTKVEYSSDGQVFTSQSAMQSLYATIMNNLEASQDLTDDGGLGNNSQTSKTAILNSLQTYLTQKEITDFTTNLINTNTDIQICKDSTNSSNTIVGTQDYIYDTYFDQYSSMSSVQQVSADISNSLIAAQALETTGAIGQLMKMITMIVIAFIIVVSVAVVVVLIVFL